jgi:hypothetical protein
LTRINDEQARCDTFLFYVGKREGKKGKKGPKGGGSGEDKGREMKGIRGEKAEQGCRTDVDFRGCWLAN